ncbi:MAG: ABC transporter ATP-binding protein [Synergistaceae bacterium]|jgi:sulfonate transport system ATP-binding protein|nr:ABC transporter ATP-binding protein [Synergistaceae bacterium]
MVRVENLTKIYETEGGTVTALRGVSLELPAGSFAALLGKSGCGKTTLLRLIAGLEGPTQGEVFCSAPRSHVGYVFQEARLMPWLSVADNIRFAERSGKKRESLGFGDVERILETLSLSGFAKAFPHELSGGMAQRVALGRTLFCRPRLILMDEPFGALDWFTRKALQRDLLRLWQEGGKTVLFVTHDIDEALLLADHVIVMREGEITDRFQVEQLHPRNSAELYSLRERILFSIEGNNITCN